MLIYVHEIQFAVQVWDLDIIFAQGAKISYDPQILYYYHRQMALEHLLHEAHSTPGETNIQLHYSMVSLLMA